MNDPERRIQNAIGIAVKYGGIDGDHHKAWVIDQMVRALSDSPAEYEAIVESACAEGWTWSEGIPP